MVHLTWLRLNVFVLLVVSVCAATEVRAEAPAETQSDADPAAAAAQQEAAPAGAKPESSEEGYYDWIQLYSGEWIKGWMETMRDETLYFESEVLYSLYIDWVSIVTLYSAQYHTYVLRDGSTVVAKGILENGQLKLNGKYYAPNRVLLIKQGGVDEIDNWYFRLRSGLSLHNASSSQFTWSNSTELLRDDGITRAALRYDGTLGQVDGDLTVSTHTGALQVDVLITSTLYLLPFYGSVTHDYERNIELRTTLGTGAGVHIIDVDGASWEVSFGPAYVSLLPITTVNGDVARTHDLGVILKTDLDVDILKDLSLNATWLSVLTVTGTDRSYHQGIASLELELSNIVTLNLSVMFDRSEAPQTTESGETPAQNSLQLDVGLGVKL